MNKNYLILTIVFATLFSPISLFAKEKTVEDIKCPGDYICLKKDDPLILASTTSCFIQQNVTNIVQEKNDDVKGKKIDSGTTSVYLESTDKDYAGVWDKFSPGVGSQLGQKEDWGFKLNLKSDTKKVIQSITVISSDGNEGWSTSNDSRIFGKYPYPLVVFSKANKQLNKSYNTVFNIDAGETVFYLYGQIELPGLDKPELVIIFNDHTYISLPIRQTSSPTDSASTKADNSVWNRVKKLFGF
jgi:hypothetical protein